MWLPPEIQEIIIVYAIQDYRAWNSLTMVNKNFLRLCHKNVSYDSMAGSFQQSKGKLRKICDRYIDMHLRTFSQYPVPEQLLASLFYKRAVDLLDYPNLSDNKIGKYVSDLDKLCNNNILDFHRLARAYILLLKDRISKTLPLYMYRGMEVFQRLAKLRVNRYATISWYTNHIYGNSFYLPSLSGSFYYVLDKSETLDIECLSM